MQGTYQIAIYGFWYTEYSITITTRVNSATHIFAGKPVSGHTEPGEVAYYNFYNSSENDLNISIVPSSGSPTIYVNSFNLYSDA
jgi:hypothetical protein